MVMGNVDVDNVNVMINILGNTVNVKKVNVHKAMMVSIQSTIKDIISINQLSECFRKDMQ